MELSGTFLSIRMRMMQVAESEAALVKRLIDRKTEVLVRGLTPAM